MMTKPARILYCHCAHAQVVPREVKEDVLRQLCAAGGSFETVGDLCDQSARKHPALKQWAAGGPLKIAACYPRAVKWLFAAADAPLSHGETEVLNMRVATAAEIMAAVSRLETEPNLPTGPAARPSSPELPTNGGTA